MPRKRLAVFTPVHPVPSGISDYCEELLPRLADHSDIDLYLDGYEPENGTLAEVLNYWSAEKFQTENEHNPYDLCIYHLGNAPCHNYIYPHLFRVPGMVVIHDPSLHATRLRTALENWRGDDYRSEMTASYGERGETAAELTLSGLHNDLLLRLFPMSALPARAGVMTVVHETWVAERIAESVPGAVVRSVPMGMELKQIDPEQALAVRRKYGISDGAFVIGTFGYLTPEKRIEPLLAAFKWLLERRADARCMLVGAAGKNLPLDEMIAGLELRNAVIVTGRLPMEAFLSHMAACDVTAFLRWPTQRETSAALLRAMSLGQPAIVSDLAHLRDLPEETVARIPLMDEECVLRDALLYLAESEPRRKIMGEAAKRYIRSQHSWDVVIPRWLELIEEAVSSAKSFSFDKNSLPQHLRAE